MTTVMIVKTIESPVSAMRGPFEYGGMADKALWPTAGRADSDLATLPVAPESSVLGLSEELDDPALIRVLSQDRNRIDGRAGRSRQPQRSDHTQERPASCLFAQRDEVLELQVIEQ
jgi:hypothetical protein